MARALLAAGWTARDGNRKGRPCAATFDSRQAYVVELLNSLQSVSVKGRAPWLVRSADDG